MVEEAPRRPIRDGLGEDRGSVGRPSAGGRAAGGAVVLAGCLWGGFEMVSLCFADAAPIAPAGRRCVVSVLKPAAVPPWRRTKW